MKRTRYLRIAGFAFLILLTACSTMNIPFLATSTPTATVTLRPTDTVTPTLTPEPTQTASPTKTPDPLIDDKLVPILKDEGFIADPDYICPKDADGIARTCNRYENPQMDLAAILYADGWVEIDTWLSSEVEDNQGEITKNITVKNWGESLHNKMRGAWQKAGYQAESFVTNIDGRYVSYKVFKEATYIRVVTIIGPPAFPEPPLPETMIPIPNIADEDLLSLLADEGFTFDPGYTCPEDADGITKACNRYENPQNDLAVVLWADQTVEFDYWPTGDEALMHAQLQTFDRLIGAIWGSEMDSGLGKSLTAALKKGALGKPVFKNIEGHKTSVTFYLSIYENKGIIQIGPPGSAE